MGVAPLAGVAATHLRTSQPELRIYDEDILCVKLAGLVHDIGHGSFSHMFEEFIHKRGRELAAKGETEQARPFTEWTHERMCEPILRQLIADPTNGIRLADYFKESPDKENPDKNSMRLCQWTHCSLHAPHARHVLQNQISMPSRQSSAAACFGKCIRRCYKDFQRRFNLIRL